MSINNPSFDRKSLRPHITLIMISAFHRGFMRECYHSGCDVDGDSITQVNYDFMAKTAQVQLDKDGLYRYYL